MNPSLCRDTQNIKEIWCFCLFSTYREAWQQQQRLAAAKAAAKLLEKEQEAIDAAGAAVIKAMEQLRKAIKAEADATKALMKERQQVALKGAKEKDKVEREKVKQVGVKG